MQKIETVCVIGAGVMGSGIAAQVANSKTNVILLDIADNESGNKNKIVNDALQAAVKSNPSPVYSKTVVQKISTGNFEDDMPKISAFKLGLNGKPYESIGEYWKW
jgi:3-hydroxyacyl-CoA dehydrogenase